MKKKCTFWMVLVSLIFTQTLMANAEAVPPKGALSAASLCTFEVDPHALKVEWTAFKTTQKVAVNGSFSDFSVKGDFNKATTFAKFLGKLQAEVKADDQAKIKTGNPARDLTLFNSFFHLFKDASVMKGSIQKVKGDEKAGAFELHLTMNHKTHSVPMTYTRDEKGDFVAKGTIELNDFALDTVFASLHKACEDLHKGADGVSKTWSTVELKLSAPIAQKCGS